MTGYGLEWEDKKRFYFRCIFKVKLAFFFFLEKISSNERGVRDDSKVFALNS